MTEILLCRALCDLIREAIKDLALPCPDGDVAIWGGARNLDLKVQAL